MLVLRLVVNVLMLNVMFDEPYENGSVESIDSGYSHERKFHVTSQVNYLHFFCNYLQFRQEPAKF